MTTSKTTHQLIHAVHHGKARYDPKWFGKGQCVLMVEKIRAPDGRVIKRVNPQTDPKVVYMLTHPDFQEEHRLPDLSYPIDKCIQYTSSVGDLDRHVAELTGQMSYFNETRGQGANRRRRLLHDHRWVHGSDVNLVDHYIDKFLEFYGARGETDTTSPLELAFADIEVDPVDHRGFPDEYDAPCPISLIGYFHVPTKTLRQYALRNTVRPNPQIAEFEADLETHRIRILCEANRAPLEKARRDPDNPKVKLAPLVAPGSDWRIIAAQLGLVEGVDADPDSVAAMRCAEVDIVFFDEEIDLILAFMERVNEIDRPDVLAYWNMGFDINTQLNRLRRLGHDPEEVFTPKDFRPWCLANYNRDNFNTEPTERNDTFDCASYTIYVDQMLLYAQLRKQSGKKESYGLDFTLREELGEHKMEYEGSIRDLSYRDFAGFMTYGALDVVPMATLEEKTEDIALAYQLSMITRTRFHKIMKKTVCLANLARIFYRGKGLVLSNNRNRNKERTEGAKFRGAFVASPDLMRPSGIMVGGAPSDRIFDDVVDFDASSMYPNIILAFAIDTTGQVGRIVLPLEDGTETDASLLMEAWASGDMVEVGRQWLGMPGLDDLLEMLAEPESELAAA